jgi:hypothetical protein
MILQPAAEADRQALLVCVVFNRCAFGGSNACFDNLWCNHCVARVKAGVLVHV